MYRPPPSSGRLREILDEWNSLVPQAVGIPRVRMWTREPPTVANGEKRLDWLKTQLLGRASTFGLTFGVELESMVRPGHYRDHVRDAIRATGLSAEVEHLNHITRPHWKLTTDGSLGDYVRGVETVSPILQGDDGFNALRTVCDALVGLRVQITKSCGLHVHVGVRDRAAPFFKQLIKLYATYEPVIDTFMAKSRRGNNSRWCSSIRRYLNEPALEAATTLDEVGVAYGVNLNLARRGEANHTKYRKLNLCNVWNRGTVEFRQHQGTVEKVKVENWVRLCLRMVLAAAKPDLEYGPVTFDGFMDTVGASAEERAYFLGRVAHFATA